MRCGLRRLRRGVHAAGVKGCALRASVNHSPVACHSSRHRYCPSAVAVTALLWMPDGRLLAGSASGCLAWLFLDAPAAGGEAPPLAGSLVRLSVADAGGGPPPAAAAAAAPASAATPAAADVAAAAVGAGEAGEPLPRTASTSPSLPRSAGSSQQAGPSTPRATTTADGGQDSSAVQYEPALVGQHVQHAQAGSPRVQHAQQEEHKGQAAAPAQGRQGGAGGAASARRSRSGRGGGGRGEPGAAPPAGTPHGFSPALMHHIQSIRDNPPHGARTDQQQLTGWGLGACLGVRAGGLGAWVLPLLQRHAVTAACLPAWLGCLLACLLSLPCARALCVHLACCPCSTPTRPPLPPRFPAGRPPSAPAHPLACHSQLLPCTVARARVRSSACPRGPRPACRLPQRHTRALDVDWARRRRSPGRRRAPGRRRRGAVRCADGAWGLCCVPEPGDDDAAHADAEPDASGGCWHAGEACEGGSTGGVGEGGRGTRHGSLAVDAARAADGRVYSRCRRWGGKASWVLARELCRWRRAPLARRSAEDSSAVPHACCCPDRAACPLSPRSLPSLPACKAMLVWPSPAAPPHPWGTPAPRPPRRSSRYRCTPAAALAPPEAALGRRAPPARPTQCTCRRGRRRRGGRAAAWGAHFVRSKGPRLSTLGRCRPAQGARQPLQTANCTALPLLL